ncbi:hypothetical protein PARC_a0597 [Pseudoalteromonas arctica A 37-1-2]|uniref:Uncharacterized protein n=1 Tax=Pseudoalteromonas arctica A 37-1-2 TaxID=1117313 RepID=A0A290RYY7_9GAMM|nr:hypothetical protein PARC_a0597 [Pseudoalteromonas arctica A 37-1-2]
MVEHINAYFDDIRYSSRLIFSQFQKKLKIHRFILSYI